jgi:hypothetical protein
LLTIDVKARLEILKIHAKKVKMDEGGYSQGLTNPVKGIVP